jgi:hypothetical protein
MAPPCRRIDLHMEDLERLVERARQTPLTDAEYETLKAAIHTLGSVAQLVEDKTATIARLRQLLFGAAPEKTRDVLDRVGRAGPEDEDHPERRRDEPTPGGMGATGPRPTPAPSRSPSRIRACTTETGAPNV